MLRLSNEQRDRILRVHGQAGHRWLSELTGRLEQCRDRWSLALDSCLVTGSGIVATGRRLGREPVVLKLIVDRSACLAESSALGSFKLKGAVTVLDQSLEDAALLLQRIVPGVPLHELVYSGSDDRATRIAGEVIARLRAAPVHIDLQLVDAVAESFEALDRHLAGQQDQTGAIPQRTVLNRRLAEITGIDRQELAMWTDAMAVVAACWQLEDGEPGWDQWLLISEALT